ncbi:FMN-dependent dehydrogenase family protein [Mycobacterium kansasii]|uniref:FMN-dependent dehydrogenase family protein n=1 Tax=Mycobacterium kansasii TaxID=1768 RepID=A0A1V3W8I3_MYCKA|nr:FMN-dependent dehydrogenase family protein [Mycobacterium kansasii]
MMIGRAYLWGWRQRQAGVENVLDILRGGIDSALMGLGTAPCRTSADDIIVPAGFARELACNVQVTSRCVNIGGAEKIR